MKLWWMAALCGALTMAAVGCSSDDGAGGAGGDTEGGEAGGDDAGGGPGGDPVAPSAPDDVDCEPIDGPDFDEVTGRNEPDVHYFAAPWPSDTRLDADGTIDVAGFPNPADVDFLQNYLDIIGSTTRAWSANAAIFLPFTGPLHPASLPADAAASLSPEASVYLETEGQVRVPIRLRWVAEETLFLPANVLTAVPVDGHVLREGTTYRLRTADWLLDAKCRPVGPAEVAFTTQTLIAPMERMREVVHTTEEPRIAGLRQLGSDEHFFAYEGTVNIPVFQKGDPPYASEGGDIEWDADGAPIIQTTQDVRVALAVPRRDMPRSGWPLVIYSHGTTGDYQTFLHNGAAAEMAQVGLASLGFDQVVHGDRVPPGSIDPQLAFVNLNNILAARDNMRQGAADGFQLMRLARQDGGISVKLDVTFSRTPTYTDPHRVLFLGHSQGAITGAPFVALEPDLLGAVFSGAGAVLRISLYERQVPVPFHDLARQFLGLNSIEGGEDEELDGFHPVSALIQTYIEPADSANYAPYFVLKRTETKGWPTPTLVIQGMLDEDVVANAGMAFIAAAGVQIADPVAQMPLAMQLRGEEGQRLPLKLNVNGVTAAALQYEDEDHFALFNNLTAKQKTYRFLETAARQEAVIAR